MKLKKSLIKNELASKIINHTTACVRKAAHDSKKFFEASRKKILIIELFIVGIAIFALISECLFYAKDWNCLKHECTIMSISNDIYCTCTE